MENNLREKTISGLTWSFFDGFFSHGINFVIGIILARILSPREFGLVGMLTIFIAISNSFIDSGFSNALIRKKKCTQEDYSTVFIFNIVIGVLFFLILFFSAGLISSFFSEPQLKSLLQVLGLSLIFSSFGIIQRTILTKNIDFKTQTKVSLASSSISGVIAIGMALNDFGVWSLVAFTVSLFAFRSLFLWVWNSWVPIFVFSRNSFNELFGYGSKLLVSSLIDTTYRNIYYLIIGKYFSAIELGYYSRADQFRSLPSQHLNSIIGRVSFPVLASIQEDKVKLKEIYKKLIRSTMFVTFILMLGMAAIAKPLIAVLIGEKWFPAVIYLQMLCFVGMFYPLHALNLNMLQVQGRSDLFLKLEIIKKILAIPVIIIGVIYGIKIMIAGMMVNTLIAYYLNSYWSGKFIGYSFLEQVKDILPSLLLAAGIGAVVFVTGCLMQISMFYLLLSQLTIGVCLTFFLCELFKIPDYLFIKEIVLEKLGRGK